jgi:hypothetical protein
MSTTASKDDGGPAFPGAVPEFINHPVRGVVHRESVGMEAESGMSLRDWFAGQALSAFIIADGAQYMSKAIEKHSLIAYQQADAMLAERSKL